MGTINYYVLNYFLLDYSHASGPLPNYVNTATANAYANSQRTTIAPNQSSIAQIQTGNYESYTKDLAPIYL